MSAHFKHKASKSGCTGPSGEPDSKEHSQGKEILREYLIEKFPKAEVGVEFYIPETAQFADVLITHPNGKSWAFEYQRSSMNIQVWEKRHNLYREAGIIDFWFLDDGIFSKSNSIAGSRRLNTLADHIYYEMKIGIFLDLGSVKDCC